jgi:hypothetical protein
MSQTLAATVNTVFKGETLRSMLLSAYGWWKVSQITYVLSLTAFGFGTLSIPRRLFGFAKPRREILAGLLACPGGRRGYRLSVMIDSRRSGRPPSRWSIRRWTLRHRTSRSCGATSPAASRTTAPAL